MRILLTIAIFTFSSVVNANSLTTLKTFFKQNKSLSAGFTQTVTDKKGKTVQQSTGTLLIQRPGKFHWRYNTPYPSEIIGDGKKIWIYDPELKQVTVKNLGDALESSPAALLAGNNNFEKNYTVKDNTPINGDMQLTAIPKAKDSSFQSIQIALANGVIQRLHLVDQLGQTTTITLQQISLNPAIKAEEFVFIPPNGVDILSE